MKTEQIIETLKDYNNWRRARGKWGTANIQEVESFFDSIKAYHKIGHTIDAAIERLQELEKERDEARREAIGSIKIFLDTGVHPIFTWEVDSK